MTWVGEGPRGTVGRWGLGWGEGGKDIRTHADKWCPLLHTAPTRDGPGVMRTTRHDGLPSARRTTGTPAGVRPSCREPCEPSWYTTATLARRPRSPTGENTTPHCTACTPHQPGAMCTSTVEWRRGGSKGEGTGEEGRPPQRGHPATRKLRGNVSGCIDGCAVSESGVRGEGVDEQSPHRHPNPIHGARA